MRKGINYPGVTIIMFCHDGNGNYLLQKRSSNTRDEHGTWGPCAGSVELGDTVEQTIQKELQEECNVLPQHIEFLGYHDVHRTEGVSESHWVALDFKIEIDRNNVVNGEPHKFEEIDWFTLDSFPEQVHSQMEMYLEDYRNRL